MLTAHGTFLASILIVASSSLLNAAPEISIDLIGSSSLGFGEIPTDFASFSYEVSCVPGMFTCNGAPRKSFIGLMNQLTSLNGDNERGPNIRIGGNSADTSVFVPGSGPLPYNATYRITQIDLEAYAAAVPLWNGTITCGMNFRGGSNASLEIAHATALSTASSLGWTPNGLIESLEVGNECDLYHENKLRPIDYSAGDYMNEANTVMNTLNSMPSNIPSHRFQGATFASHNFDNITGEYIDANRNNLFSISHHEYSLSVCDGVKNLTIQQLLAYKSIFHNIDNLLPVIGNTTQRGLPFFIGEGNSVSCGGQEGVSDVFGSALWALDILLSHAEIGVKRWNFHGCEQGAYTAIAYGNTSIDSPDVRPLFYGMFAMTYAARNGSEMWNSKVTSSSDLLRSHTTKAPDNTWRIIVLHKDPSSSAANVIINLPKTIGTIAKITRLEAPTVLSKKNVTFGGLTWDNTSDGTPSGTPKSDYVSQSTDGKFYFTVPPSSALIFEIQ